MTHDDEIILHLALPQQSFRIFALEQAIRQGKSPALLEALERHREVESDEECRMLLAHALQMIQKRLAVGSGTPASQPARALVFPEAFDSLPTTERFACLESVRSEADPTLPAHLPELIHREHDPGVLTALLRLYAREWNEEKATFFTAFLTSPRLSARLCALEILLQRAPETLRDSLPQLLTGGDCRVRALAIRGLAAIDADEAVEHFEHLLLATDAVGRLAALQVSVFLPFDRIRESLLKYAAAESDPEMLDKALLLFAHNPDPEIPFRLFELAESSPLPKAEKLKRCVQTACRNLKASGVMCETFDEFMAKLQTWIYRRQAAKFAQTCLERIQEVQGPPPAEWAQVIRQSLSKPFFREAFEEALSWPLAAETKTTLTALLAGKPEPGCGPVPAAAARPPFEQRSLDDQIRAVTAAAEAASPELDAMLTRLFQLRNPHPDLLATSLRMALKNGIGTYLEPARKLLKHPSPNTISSALEYLATFDCDAVFPFLGKYLQSGDPRIKTTALKILRQHDLAQGLSALKAMLARHDPGQNRAALACMVYFDFSLIRDFLTAFLEKTTDETVFRQGLCLFQANPDPESLYLVYRLEHNAPVALAATARDVYGAMEQQLVKERRLSPGDDLRKAGLYQRLETEMRRRSTPPPAYALKTLTMAGSQGRSFFLSEKFWVPGIIVLLLIGWGLFPEQPPNEAAGAAVAPIPPNVATVELIGQVIAPGASLGGFCLETQDGRIVKIHAPGATFTWLRSGDWVKARVLLSSQEQKSMPEARLRSVCKIRPFPKKAVKE
jgi:HEAT repeat protein